MSVAVTPNRTGYLQTRRIARSQYRVGRRGHRSGKTVTGAIVIHTAESILRPITADTGAEAVADYMVRRPEAGSYHDIADSDSIVHLVDYQDEAFHDGTGTNRYSLGLSFACRTSDWVSMPDKQRAGFMKQGAIAAARMIRWLDSVHDIDVPLARITATQARAGRPGFTTHAELDPSRRSDPGRDFPWSEFFAAVRKELGTAPSPSKPTGGLTMSEAARLDKRIDTMRNATLLLIEAANKRIDTLRNATRLIVTAEGQERTKAIAALEATVDEMAAELDALRNA